MVGGEERRKVKRRERGLEVREKEERLPGSANCSPSVDIKARIKVAFDYLPWLVWELVSPSMVVLVAHIFFSSS